jgi:hypothetical protein
MTSSIFTTCFLTALLLGYGPSLTQEVSPMLFAGTRSAAAQSIPPMDREVPDKLETATFALG